MDDIKSQNNTESTKVESTVLTQQNQDATPNTEASVQKTNEVKQEKAEVTGVEKKESTTSTTEKETKKEGIEENKSKEEIYELTMPEAIPYNKDVFSKFNNVVNSFKLPKEQAQELLNIAIENANKANEDYMRTRQDWIKEIKNDPEFGNANFSETVSRAQRVLSDPEIGSPKLIELLNSTGLGDNPELIKALAKIDKKYGEDKMVSGKPAGTSYKSAAEIFYPNTK